MSDDREGVRLDTYASCSDGQKRDVFDPAMSSADFNAFVATKLKVEGALPSQSIAIALDLIADMRHAVVLFNQAYESDEGVDDDDVGVDDDT